MNLDSKLKEEIRTLSAKYLGSPNRAFVMMEKGVTIPMEDSEGKPVMAKSKDGKTLNSVQLQMKRYSAEEMIEKLRLIDTKVKEKELMDKVQREASGSVK